MGRPDESKFERFEEIKEDLRRELRQIRERNRRIKPFIQGRNSGVCQLCGESKTVILLRGGLSACGDCLDLSMDLLKVANPITKEKLQFILKLQKLLDEKRLE